MPNTRAQTAMQVASTAAMATRCQRRQAMESQMKTPPENLGVSDALRKAGYVRIPDWWVTPDQLEVIHRMAHGHQDEINRIRRETKMRREKDEIRRTNAVDDGAGTRRSWTDAKAR